MVAAIVLDRPLVLQRTCAPFDRQDLQMPLRVYTPANRLNPQTANRLGSTSFFRDSELPEGCE